MATSFAVLAAMIGSAGPAAAASDPPWEMPDVKGMLLQQAVDAVYDVTGPVEMDLDTYDTKGNREQLNYANWTICWQYPKAGADLVLYKSKATVAFGVKRASDEKCY